VVPDPHAALARLAAAFHGEPARALTLLGITGTLGKTSTALLVETALAASGGDRSIGVVGSLGARVRGPAAARLPAGALPDLSGMTTPDAPVLHQAFRAMVDAGVRTVAMEVTSHALAQRRVEGLRFALGILTNLVPDEHLEFHPTPEDYLATKARFLDKLALGAPLVVNADDPLVRDMVRHAVARTPRPVIGVSLGEAAHALSDDDVPVLAADDLLAPAVTVEALRADAGGSTCTLRLHRPIPRLEAVGGGTVPAQAVPIVLPVLGVQQVANVALAAVAALVAGATPAGVTEALAEMEPMHRRMEVVHAGGPLVVDDTAGNPQTLRAVFASVAGIARRELRVVFGVRGLRGAEINRRLARTLAAEVARAAGREPVTLVVTASEERADARNRVTPEEREAALAPLRDAGVAHAFEPRLDDAVRRLLDGVPADALVLVLGAQGMDTAAALVRATLGAPR
jgi:UDP-N-acetylmuramoyl-L-alanyl-D-glutamate--2,6-diaminopimelate ligase